MKYFRVHTADMAYMTKQPRGLFAAISKLVDAKTLSEEETAEYWKNREYFEKVLPVPPFYDQGNPDGAITWFKDTAEGNRIWEELGFYRNIAEKYSLQLYISECTVIPGEVIYEDAFQVAVRNVPDNLPLSTRKL